MAIITEQYYQMLMGLMPRGKLWDDLQEDPNIIGLWRSIAEELAILHAREQDLIRESDPRTTREMFTDWENTYDLPDPCVGDDLTFQERQAMLIAKYKSIGGQKEQFFIDLAESLGYQITISTFKPFMVNSKVNQRLRNTDARYLWRVNAPATTKVTFKVNSRVNEPLAVWGNERLECIIRRYAPAQTIVKFSYGG